MADTRAARGDFTATTLQDSSSSWGWYLFLGVIVALIGLFALSSVVVTSVLTAELVGWLFLLGGVVSFFSIFFVSEGRFANATLGILYGIVGAIIISNPLMTLGALTLFLAIAWTVGGIARVLGALFSESYEGRGWAILAGIVTLVLGLLVWAGWPEASLYFVGLFLGIDLLVAGVAMSIYAFRLRRNTAVASST